MADTLYICRGTAGTMMQGTLQVPTCDGNFVLLDYVDPAAVDPVIAIEAMGAGLIVMGVPLIVALVGRRVIDTIRGNE